MCPFCSPGQASTQFAELAQSEHKPCIPRTSRQVTSIGGGVRGVWQEVEGLLGIGYGLDGVEQVEVGEVVHVDVVLQHHHHSL